MNNSYNFFLKYKVHYVRSHYVLLRIHKAYSNYLYFRAPILARFEKCIPIMSPPAAFLVFGNVIDESVPPKWYSISEVGKSPSKTILITVLATFGTLLSFSYRYD